MAGLLPFGASAQSLHITTGCKMVMAGGANLMLSNINFVNDGVLTAPVPSCVRFIGAGNSGISIGGASTTSFALFQILRPGDLTLNADIEVRSFLSLSQGRIQLNNHTLNLGTAGMILGENNSNYITGTSGGSILATKNFVAASPANPGNIGLEITLAAGTVGGTLTIERKHQSETVTPGGIQSIQRSYTVTGTKVGQTNMKLRAFYTDPDIFDTDEAQMVFWTGNAGGFQQIGKDSNNTSANWVAKSGFTAGGHFVLANPNTGGGATMGVHPGSQTTGVQGLTDPAGASAVSSARVYPNPVHDQFVLELSGKAAKEVRIGLYDASGHLLQQKEWYCQIGKNTISWDLSGYGAGIYYLSIPDSGVKNIKIVKE